MPEGGALSVEWYHVLYEVERAPRGMLRQSGVQGRTRLAQYNVCGWWTDWSGRAWWSGVSASLTRATMFW